MPGYKRFRKQSLSYKTTKRRRSYPTRTYKTKSYGKRTARGRFARNVMSVVNKRAETKVCYHEVCSNKTVYHNTGDNLYNDVLAIPRGSNGEAETGATQGTRIGKKVYIKGVKVSMLLESQQYRPQVSYWIYLVKSKRNTATIGYTDMYEGISSTTPCDYIDKDKVTVLYCKKVTLRMPNTGTSVAMNQSVDGTLINGTAYRVSGGEDYELFTNPKKCMKFYVPINKTIEFIQEGELEDTTQPWCRYQWFITAYDNFTTKTGTPQNFPTGHITMTQKILFTDV